MFREISPINERFWGANLIVKHFFIDTPIHIINVIAASVIVEYRSAVDAIVLGEIEVVPDFPDDFSITQYVSVVLFVLQAVNIRFNLHISSPPPLPM